MALGGGVVYAAGKISSSDIARDAIKAKHIQDGQVKGPDVDESSLGVVPSAQTAQTAETAETAESAGSAQSATTAQSAATAESATSAQSVGGVTEKLVRASQPADTAIAQVDEVDGLKISIACNASGDGQVRTGGSATGDHGTMIGTFNSPSTPGEETFAATFSNAGANTMGLGGTPSFMTGTSTLRRPGGRVVRFDWDLRELTNGFGTADDCFLQGFVRSAP